MLGIITFIFSLRDNHNVLIVYKLNTFRRGRTLLKNVKY